MNEPKGRKPNLILPVILLLMPLLAINFGFYFLEEIDLYWRNTEQSDQANQEIEGISSASDFAYQFSKTCGQYSNILKSAVEGELKGETLKKHLLDRAKKVFRPPFPDKDLFVFEIPENTGKCELILVDSQKRIQRRVLERVFDYLVKLNRNDEIPDYLAKTNETLLKNILGAESSGNIIANSQRARTSYALYKVEPNWLNWDYFTVPGRGTFGHIVISKTLDRNRFDGMLLALRDFRDRRIGLAGFVPLFKGYGNPVIQAPLHRSKLYKSWLKNHIKPVENNLAQWLASGTPPVAELGNFKVFSYLGKGNTHLTTLVLPRLKKDEMPLWLKLLNFIILGGLLIFHGLIQQHWPAIKLKLRFQIIFLLAATLPLSLLIISASGYLSQFRRSIHFQTVSNLLLCIKQYDSRKAQIEEEYRTAFNRFLKDPELAKIMEKEGSYSSGAEKLLRSYFDEAKKPLPLMCYAFFNETASGTIGYNNGNKGQLDSFINSFKYPIVGYMRQQIQKTDPSYKLSEYEPKQIETLGVEAYRSVTSLDLIEEIGKRRSYPLIRMRAGSMATQMHDLVKVGNLEPYAAFIAWEDQALDEQTIRQTTNFLSLNNPEYTFAHFKASAQKIEPTFHLSRHVPADALSAARKIAESVFFKGSLSSTQTRDYSIVAFPSQKYPGIIITGIARNFSIEEAIFNRMFSLGLIAITAIFIVLFLAFISAKIILSRITKLKHSLDQIAAGNLDTEIEKSGNDEIGNLALEFSEMTKGLRERNRLASLLSDHAIEALSRTQNVDGALSGEAFSGVALVSDIRNFTGLCESQPADRITELLNEHFAKMAAIISKQGGRIYKFIGDAIEAVFPEDENYEEAPELRAFKAASLMNIEQMKITRTRIQNQKFGYKFGIGLASGRFFSGGTGSIDTRLDYAVLGEPLKRAAQLEAISIKNPAFPVVVDEKIALALKESSMILTRLPDEEAWTMLEISNNLILATELENVDEDQSSVYEKIENLDAVSTQSPGLYFSIAMLGLIAILAGVFLGFKFRGQTLIDLEKVYLAEQNLRLLEQLKGESVFKIGFENLCHQSINRIEKQLNFVRTANEPENFKRLVEAEIETFAGLGVKIKRSMTLYYPEFNNAGGGPGFAKTILNYGWKPQIVELMEKFAHYKHHFDYDLPRMNLREELDRKIPEVFGNGLSMTSFYDEIFGTAIEVEIDGNREQFFARYITVRSEALNDIDFSNEIFKLRLKGDENDFRIVGMVVFVIDKLECHSLKTVLGGFQDTRTFLAAQPLNSSQIFFSPNFPTYLQSYAKEKDGSVQSNNFVRADERIIFNGQEFQLMIFSETQTKQFSMPLLAGIFAVLTLVFGTFLFKLSYGTSLVNKSLILKLWMAVISCSLIPVITVLFVVDLFAIENFNAQFSQEKAQLQRFLDLFEHRQSFSEPLAWRSVKDFSYSEKLKKAVEKVNEQPLESKDMTPLNLIFKEFDRNAGELKKEIANYEPRDATIVSKQGWEFIKQGSEVQNYDEDLPSAGASKDKDNQFALLLAKIGQNLIKRMRVQDGGQSFDANSLIGEEALRIGLRTVSAMFGEDIALKLANGVGLPVKMAMLDSVIGLIIYPVDQVFMPDYIVIWMILFRNGDYLGKIADKYQGDSAVFPIESTDYGRITTPFKNLFDFGLPRINAWVSSSNLPVSLIKEYKGKKFMVESRRGIQQISMVMTGIKPVQPIYEKVRITTLKFLFSIFLSVIFIILLAKNVSAEIIDPVKQLTSGMTEIEKENFTYRINPSRSDELGDLCQSFDRMARGLEEKFLIGKMLSQNAMKSTLAEMVSRKEEAVILYAGSPGFSSWLKLSKPNELFSDLQKQVSEISRIILQEGGDIDKIIGEKILAVFRGTKTSASMAACKAAKRIMLLEQKATLPFPVAAGINHGIVISGVLGVGEKKDFTVIGDAVNVAARIEGLAETMRYNRTLISEEVAAQVKAEMLTREYGSVELKGKTHAAKVFQLEA
ncbi:MAG: adenylate/guanylate cyclase domain-containing protein [Candidatus Rifleibacteriota bacterium]